MTQRTPTQTRLTTIAKTRGLELPEAFSCATVAAAANGKGSKTDLRRYANRARVVTSLPEHLAQVRAEDVRSARKFEGL